VLNINTYQHDITGPAYEVFEVRQFLGQVPHPVTGVLAQGGRLRIARTAGGVPQFWEWTQVGTNWNFIEGSGPSFNVVLRSELLEIQHDAFGGRIETRTMKNAPSMQAQWGIVASKERSVFAPLNGEDSPVVLVSRTLDPDGSALSTTYQHDTNPASVTYGMLLNVVSWDGSWTQYFRDGQARLIEERRSYLGNQVGDPLSDSTHYRYFYLDLLNDSITDTVVEATQVTAGLPVSRQLRVYWRRQTGVDPSLRQEVTTIDLANVQDVSSSYGTLIASVVASPFNQPHAVFHSARGIGSGAGVLFGVADVGVSSSGAINVTTRSSTQAGHWMTSTYSGRAATTIGLLAIVDSAYGSGAVGLLAPGYEKSVVVRNAFGHIIQSTQFAHDGTTEQVMSSRLARTFEANGPKYRVTKYESVAGPAADEDIEYDCCRVIARVDHNGVRSEYDYDALGRVIAERREIAAGQFVSTNFTYDALNRVRSVIRRDTSGGTGNQIVESSTTYDIAGRATSVYRAGSGTTTQSEVVTNGRIIRTAVLQDPDASGPESGPVIVETLYPDGRTESVAGSGAAPLMYEYGVAADTDPLASLNGFAAQWTKTIKVGDGNSLTEWSTIYIDQFGNSYKQVAADGATSRRFYDTAGRLVKSTDPDGVTTLYRTRGDGDTAAAAAVQFALDSTSADWSLTAIDMDQDGQVDFSNATSGSSGTLADQIRLTQRFVSSDQDGLWRVRSTKIWIDPANANLSTTVNATYDRADGLVQQSFDFGRKTVTSLVRSRAAASVRIDVFNPDSTSSGTLTTYGLVRSAATFSNVANSTPLTQAAYFYDAFGRREQTVDTRGTASTADDRVSSMTFNSVGLPVTSTTPAPAAGEPSQTTTTVYDALGRVIRVDLPDGASQHTAYFPNGKVRKNYGARMYPSEYTYDAQGRTKTLKTWKDFNESTGTGTAGAAVTTWNYSPTRGFLTSKTYEGNQPGPTYAYKPSGRLLTRTWARGVSTTYGYNNAGQLASVNYSDDTPDVAMKFDRRGRIIEVVDGVGTRTLVYANDNSLLTEDFAAGPLDEISQHSGYDAFGRRTSFELRKNNTAFSTLGYGYDAQTGRYAHVTKGGLRADYGYEPGGNLLNSLTFRSGTAVNSTVTLTTSYNVDAIGRLRSISHDSVLGTDESYTYAYDAANQRVRLDLIDGSSWAYGYDAMGQVISGKRYRNGGNTPTNPLPGQQYEYAFDDIGNRTNAKMGGDVNGANLRTTTYTSNALNQYTERNNNRSSDVMGYAPAANSVLVKGSPADFRWNRFYQEHIPRSSGGAILDLVDIEWDANAQGPEDWRAVIVPPTLEKYLYDLDGNMTQDARWQYFWDGENRLVRMETRANLSPSIPRRKLEFSYDYASRRVKREGFGWIDIDINPDPGEGGVIVEDEGSGSSGGGSGGEPDPNSVPDGFWDLDGSWHFLWDGWNLAAELTGDLTPWRSYGWGLDLSQTEQGAGGVGGLLFSTEHNYSPAPATRFTTYDGNGNVTSYRTGTTLGSTAAGVTIAAYEYGPFGEIATTDGLHAGSQPFRFSTKYQDGETGLLYYGYRYYHAGTGRWLSRDPMEESGGHNLHARQWNALVGTYDARGAKEELTWEEVWKDVERDYKKRGAGKKGLKWAKYELGRGCVGAVAVMLGVDPIQRLGNCYGTKAQADAVAKKWRTEELCDMTCPNEDSVGVFSIHLWNDTGRDKQDPDVTVDPITGKLDLSNWDYQAKPNGNYVNFDFGYCRPDGRLLHADMYHNPDEDGDGKGDRRPDMPIRTATYFISTLAEWQAGAPTYYQYSNFNTEAWCVSCKRFTWLKFKEYQ
jgi:RHS repeat-associated protein